jgi:hypothetical protein
MKRSNRARRSIIASCDNPKQKEVYRAALAYVGAGLSLIPIEPDLSKRPAFKLLPEIDRANGGRPIRSWKPFQQRRPTEEQIHSWFNRSIWEASYGMAILGGKVSGNLEILDVDTFDLVKPLRIEIEKRCPGLFDQLVAVKSPRPGLHLYYRCDEIGGNQKLARIRDPKSDIARAKTILKSREKGATVWHHRHRVGVIRHNAAIFTMATKT